MKTYSTLRAISYNDFENYPMIVEKRKESESSVFTGLFFQAFDAKQELLLKEEMELFFLVLPQTSLLKDKLNENSRQIDKLMNSLPEITKKNIFYHLLVEEIKASNDIEGVQSTRKEIRDAISVILEKSQEDKRFKSLVYQYMNFRKSKFSQITTIEDIREIYEKLLKDEVAEEDKLSTGELFRSEPVFIVDQRTGKKVHQGAGGQEIIKKRLAHLVKFMNQEDIPTFEKAFISHFYFENIHPFYDGNGRIGRFILCSYLARKLDYLSAIGVSVAILENKNKYYKAFQETSHPKNAGEATSFILDMFDILLKAQEKILSALKEWESKLDTLQKNIQKLEQTNDERSVIYPLAQVRMYDSLDVLTDADIAVGIGISRQKLKNILKDLKEKKHITQVKQKPSIHELTDEFWSELQK